MITHSKNPSQPEKILGNLRNSSEMFGKSSENHRKSTSLTHSPHSLMGHFVTFRDAYMKSSCPVWAHSLLIVFMGFFSFSSPLATVQVPIFCPAFLLWTDPLLFFFWHLISAVMNDPAFSYTKGTWRRAVI